jgi:hypothetical protein
VGAVDLERLMAADQTLEFAWRADQLAKAEAGCMGTVLKRP